MQIEDQTQHFLPSNVVFEQHQCLIKRSEEIISQLQGENLFEQNHLLLELFSSSALFFEDGLLTQNFFYPFFNRLVNQILDNQSKRPQKIQILKLLSNLNYKHLDYQKLAINEEKILKVLNEDEFMRQNFMEKHFLTLYNKELMGFLRQLKYRFRHHDVISFVWGQKSSFSEKLEILCSVVDIKKLNQEQFRILQTLLGKRTLYDLLENKFFFDKFLSNQHLVIDDQIVQFILSNFQKQFVVLTNHDDPLQPTNTLSSYQRQIKSNRWLLTATLRLLQSHQYKKQGHDCFTMIIGQLKQSLSTPPKNKYFYELHERFLLKLLNQINSNQIDLGIYRDWLINDAFQFLTYIVLSSSKHQSLDLVLASLNQLSDQLTPYLLRELNLLLKIEKIPSIVTLKFANASLPYIKQDHKLIQELKKFFIEKFTKTEHDSYLHAVSIFFHNEYLLNHSNNKNDFLNLISLLIENEWIFGCKGKFSKQHMNFEESEVIEILHKLQEGIIKKFSSDQINENLDSSFKYVKRVLRILNKNENFYEQILKSLQIDEKFENEIPQKNLILFLLPQNCYQKMIENFFDQFEKIVEKKSVEKLKNFSYQLKFIVKKLKKNNQLNLIEERVEKYFEELERNRHFPKTKQIEALPMVFLSTIIFNLEFFVIFESKQKQWFNKFTEILSENLDQHISEQPVTGFEDKVLENTLMIFQDIHHYHQQNLHFNYLWKCQHQKNLMKQLNQFDSFSVENKHKIKKIVQNKSILNVSLQLYLSQPQFYAVQIVDRILKSEFSVLKFAEMLIKTLQSGLFTRDQIVLFLKTLYQQLYKVIQTKDISKIEDNMHEVLIFLDPILFTTVPIDQETFSNYYQFVEYVLSKDLSLTLKGMVIFQSIKCLYKLENIPERINIGIQEQAQFMNLLGIQINILQKRDNVEWIQQTLQRIINNKAFFQNPLFRIIIAHLIEFIVDKNLQNSFSEPYRDDYQNSQEYAIVNLNESSYVLIPQNRVSINFSEETMDYLLEKLQEELQQDHQNQDPFVMMMKKMLGGFFARYQSVTMLFYRFFPVLNEESQKIFLQKLKGLFEKDEKWNQTKHFIFRILLVERMKNKIPDIFDDYLILYIDFLVREFQLKHFISLLNISLDQRLNDAYNPLLIKKLLQYLFEGATNKQKMLSVLFSEFINPLFVNDYENYSKLITDRKFNSNNSNTLYSLRLKNFLQGSLNNRPLSQFFSKNEKFTQIIDNPIFSVLHHNELSLSNLMFYKQMMTYKEKIDVSSVSIIFKHFSEQALKILDSNEDQQKKKQILEIVQSLDIQIDKETTEYIQQIINKYRENPQYLITKELIIYLLNIIYRDMDVTVISRFRENVTQLVKTNKYQVLELFRKAFSLYLKSKPDSWFEDILNTNTRFEDDIGFITFLAFMSQTERRNLNLVKKYFQRLSMMRIEDQNKDQLNQVLSKFNYIKYNQDMEKLTGYDSDFQIFEEILSQQIGALNYMTQII